MLPGHFHVRRSRDLPVQYSVPAKSAFVYIHLNQKNTFYEAYIHFCNSSNSFYILFK